MRYALRAIAILTGSAAVCMVATTVAYATMLHDPFPAGTTPTSSGSGGSPIWQLLALVALGVLLAGAIVGLGHSLSHSRKSERAQRSQQPLTH